MGGLVVRSGGGVKVVVKWTNYAGDPKTRHSDGLLGMHHTQNQEWKPVGYVTRYSIPLLWNFTLMYLVRYVTQPAVILHTTPAVPNQRELVDHWCPANQFTGTWYWLPIFFYNAATLIIYTLYFQAARPMDQVYKYAMRVQKRRVINKNGKCFLSTRHLTKKKWSDICFLCKDCLLYKLTLLNFVYISINYP